MSASKTPDHGGVILKWIARTDHDGKPYMVDVEPYPVWTATISKARHFKTEKEAQDYLFTDPDGVADWYGFVAVVHVRRKRGGGR